MTSPSPSIDEWHRGVPAGVRKPILIGAAILLLCVGGFGVWAPFAPLEGAVVVSGSFVATGQNKHVQHLEGGILREVLVKEGDLVEAGQPLLRLDATAASTKLRRLVLQEPPPAHHEGAARGRDRWPGHALRMPAELAADAARTLKSAGIFDRQVTELQARRAEAATEEEVLRKEIAGLQESIGGYTAQAKSTRQRLALFAEELKDKQQLLAQQLARRTEILAAAALRGRPHGRARRADGAHGGRQGAHRACRAADRSVALRGDAEDHRGPARHRDRAGRPAGADPRRARRGRPHRGARARARHRRQAAPAHAGRRHGRRCGDPRAAAGQRRAHHRGAPQSRARSGTSSGPGRPGAAVRPQPAPDADGRRQGRSISRPTPWPPSTRARKAEQEPPQRPSYVVRVRLDEQDVRSKLLAFQPTPGMPADVFIKTGERTFFDYIMRPVWDSFSRAFRESS